MSAGLYATFGLLMVASLSLSSSMFAASSSGGGKIKDAAASSNAAKDLKSTGSLAPKTFSDGSVEGKALSDPTQGGKCATTKGREKACGTVNCTSLPKCPTYLWMNYEKFIIGTVKTPSGITDKSSIIAGGLDPKGVLDIVNKMRAQVGSPAIKWDDSLACAAAAWIPLTSYDMCPHGAAPGFPFYAQVIGSHTSPNATPMQVAQYAIEEQFFKQEKAIADPLKITGNAEKAQKEGWKLGTFADTIDDRCGHYIILTSSQATCCGFSFGYNYTKSGYVRPPQEKMALVCGHFA